MSIDKCVLMPSTRLVFLGIVCDSLLRRFEVPEDKLDKLEAIISEAISTQCITFTMLEKLAGKCTSMTVAVPIAGLYTHHMYKHIADFQRKGGKKSNMDIRVTPNSGLRYELGKWLEVRSQSNGASWYRAAHQRITLHGATDASSRGWGGLIRSPGHELFQAAGDFPDEWAEKHINVQEAYALLEILRLFCQDRHKQVAGSTVVLDVDNKTLFHAFNKGRAKDTSMHDVITDLFWLQVKQDFTLKLRWVASADNAEADDLSRPEAGEYVRLEPSKFAELWAWAGTFDMDLMATPASAQKAQSPHPGSGERLPFYSRFRTDGSEGIDVLSQDVSRLPNSSQPCFGFCFPPTTMVGVVLQHIAECRARAVVVVPDQRQSWFPLLSNATKRSFRVAGPGDTSAMFRVHHQRGKVPFAFKRWGMRAVEVDFR